MRAKGATMQRRAALLVFLLILCASAGCALSSQRDETLPLYGGVESNIFDQVADKKFVETAIQIAGSRELAADACLKRGWDYLQINDTINAIKRFNQAWLLKPNHPRVYWGLAMALAKQCKREQAIKLFEQARALAPNDPLLLVDYAFVLWSDVANGKLDRGERDATIARAHGLLNEAEQLDQRFPKIWTNRAMLYLLQADYAASWRSVDRAQELDPRSVHERFLRDLSSKMTRPAKQ